MTTEPTENVPQAKLDVITKGNEIHARQVQQGPTPAPLPAAHAASCPQKGDAGTIEAFSPAGAVGIPGGRGYRNGAASSMADGQPLRVFAGADQADPSQGILRIEKLARDLCASESPEAGAESFNVGDHAGPVELVAVAGSHVTFRFVQSGCTGSYDVKIRDGAANNLVGRLAVPTCEAVSLAAPSVVATASAP